MKRELKWGQKILVKGKDECLCEPEQIEAFKATGWSDPDEPAVKASGTKPLTASDKKE